MRFENSEIYSIRKEFRKFSIKKYIFIKFYIEIENIKIKFIKNYFINIIFF